MSDSLKIERDVFEKNIGQWRQTHLGEYVLIKHDVVEGFFRSLDEAFRKGSELHGLQNFFIKQIKSDDVVNVSFLGKSIKSA